MFSKSTTNPPHTSWDDKWSSSGCRFEETMLNNCVQHHQSQRTSITQTKDEVSRGLCLWNVCLLTLFCSFLSLTSIFFSDWSFLLMTSELKHPQRCKCKLSTETMVVGNDFMELWILQFYIFRSSSVFQQEALKLYHMLCFYCIIHCFSYKSKFICKNS